MFRTKRPSSIAAVSVANQYEVGRGAELCAWALNTWRNWVDLFSSVQFSPVQSHSLLRLWTSLKNRKIQRPIQWCNSVFILGIFFLGGGGFPNGCQYCVLSIIIGRDNESQIYHANFLLMDNKHRELFAMKQLKRCKFMPKLHQNTLGGRVPPGPVGGAYALPQTA